MIAVLAERHDPAARQVHDTLSRRVGPDRVIRVLPADLVRARWSHRVAGSGAVTNRVHLADGRHLAPDAVLHRLAGVPGAAAAATAKDRDYIASEFNALVASWLLSLGHRVLGPTGAHATALGPTPVTALATAERCGLPVVRRWQATRAGLTGSLQPGERSLPRIDWPGASGAPVPVEVVPDRPLTTRLLVAAGRVHGSLADRFGVAALSLARAIDTSLLELSFTTGPALVEVTTMPRLGTTSHVEAVADALIALAHAEERP